MSRWRETLCGSVIKQAPEAQVGMVNGPLPTVLTCGGSHRPHRQKTFSLYRPKGVIFLPKDSYDVLIPGADDDWVHYNIQVAQQREDVETLEAAIKQIEASKQHK